MNGNSRIFEISMKEYSGWYGAGQQNDSALTTLGLAMRGDRESNSKKRSSTQGALGFNVAAMQVHDPTGDG
jgi:hypothetical protein